MKNLILLFLLLPFIFAGSFQSYTEKTVPEDADIMLILDSDDLTTKKVQLGNLPGGSINWATIDDMQIQSDGINWASLNQDIQKVNVNWTSLDNSIQTSGINWTSVNDNIQSNGINWESLNQDIQYTGINWSSANFSINGPSGNVEVGSTPSISIDGSNHVGIGTTANSFYALYVASRDTGFTLLRLEDRSSNFVSNSALDFVFSPTYPANTIKNRANSKYLALTNSSGDPSNGLSLNQSANVGLGTFNAGAKLEISKTSANPLLMISSTANTDGDYLIVTSNGNVGLGSTNPNGALVVRTSASDIGWSKQSGANTACNTTCTASCVFGQNTGDMSIVDCADATADVCICAGSN